MVEARWVCWSLAVLVLLVLPAPAGAARAAAVQPSPAQLVDPVVLGRVDALVEQAIARGEVPGAVLLVGRGDVVLHRKAYGQRSVSPTAEPMTLDTIFDMASITKIVATTTSVMILVEEGRLRLSDRVASHIPEFGRYGKESITIQQLLTHTSGLRSGIDRSFPWLGYEKAIELVTEEVLATTPGERFVYSDAGFLLLAEIVARVSGRPLDRFARERVLQPLGMNDSTFNPPESLRPRIAPTQLCTPYGWPCEGPDATMLRGVVHDPTARRMHGIAGSAGLFSTADDLARYCRMIINGGALGSTRILSPLGVIRMTSPATPPGVGGVRGLGWDIDTSFSVNRGELLPLGSFGHTGWTGTSLWIDPNTGTYIILLTNRVHPDGTGDAGPLRARVATVVAAALRDLPADATLRRASWSSAHVAPSGVAPPRADAAAGRTLNGIDVLRASDFAPLAGKRVGLVTSRAARARTGESSVDLLVASPAVNVVALFSPEHGFEGLLEGEVISTTDAATRLPVHSLYGATRRPTAGMLAGIDTLVIDLPDVGVRFYTYATTMAYVMEAAAQHGIPVVVLDRANPVNGVAIEGPALDPGELGFTGYHSMPIRHGLTLGELAGLFNGVKSMGVDLTVVALQHWTRETWFDDTGLTWVNPSPNMRNLVAASLYPGVGAIEMSNLSVGRGTDTPFQVVGAPWVDGPRLAAALNERAIPGLRVYPVSFTPRASAFAGEACEGVFIVVTAREQLRPVRLGLELAAALHRLHPADFALDGVATLFGADVVQRIRRGEDTAAIAASWNGAEDQWRLQRAPFLLYR